VRVHGLLLPVGDVPRCPHCGRGSVAAASRFLTGLVTSSGRLRMAQLLTTVALGTKSPRRPMGRDASFCDWTRRPTTRATEIDRGTAGTGRLHLREERLPPLPGRCGGLRGDATVRDVTDRSGPDWFEADALRRLVPIVSLVVALVAAVTQPSSPADLILAIVPVVAFVVWAFVPRTPLLVLSAAVIVPVVLAQRTGDLEPLMFEASLLGFVVGRWSPSVASSIPLALLAAATPVLVAQVQEPAEVAVAIWVMGILFPWAISLAFVRQERLAEQLEETKRQLAQQALVAERREVARDVHDFVGHGLAAVMLQVTSARHVLRRDPAAAEEALRSAEDVGRRSMQELRRTVALLRSEDGNGVEPPVPSVAEIPALVDQARAGGMAVELQMRGDLSAIPPSIGVAVYRITQEALANAARHAPRARTAVGLALTNGRVDLVAETTGPLEPVWSDPQRPRFGLLGMRERATALGGELAAGPTPGGWRVSCQLPLANGSGR
jgi:signal transduction histidine kinase